MSETPYDPQATEDESKSSSQYFSIREVRVIVIVLVVLVALMYPIYKMLESNAHRAQCSKNIGAIYYAMSLYAEQHEGQLPPAYATTDDGVTPFIDPASGLPQSWNGDVLEYLTSRASFLCPSAEEVETAYVTNPRTGDPLPVTYGMYLPYGSYSLSQVENPEQTVIVAETSNFGALDTFDPVKFLADSGRPIRQDAFVIGWSNSNEAPNADTRSVTRLAFRDTSDGGFGPDASGRHNQIIHGVTASGQLMRMEPQMALVEIDPGLGLPGDTWVVPPRSLRR